MSSFYPPRSTREHFVEPPILDRIISRLPGGIGTQMQSLWDKLSYSNVSTQSSTPPKSLRQAKVNWNPARLLSLPHLFVTIWVLLLLWGERWVFERSISRCEWGKWERWVSHLESKAFRANLYSPKMQHRTIWCSWLILNLSIRTPTQVDRGLSRPLRPCIQIITLSAHICNSRRSYTRIRCSSWAIYLTGAGNGRQPTATP
jgi:hypothetical protein